MKFPTFVPGYDATADTSAIARSKLLQTVVEQEFVDEIGAVIYKDAAPDVALYPKLAWFTWHRTVSGAATGEEYYWDGTTWMAKKLKDGSLTGDAFADGSIGLSKLTPPGADYSLNVVQVNAAGNGFQFTTVINAIANNTIAWAKLINASAAGHVLYSGSGGVFISTSFSGLFASSLLAAGIPVANLVDLADEAAPNAVVCFPTPGGDASLKKIAELYEDSTIDPKKLILAGLAGKLIRVNATANGFTGADTAYSAAIVRGTANQGVDGPKYTGAGPHIVPLTTKNDPNSIVVSLTANVFKLGVGTYELEINIPIESANDSGGDDAMPMQICLYKDSTVIDYVTFWTSDDAQGTRASMKTILSVTEESSYKFMIDNPSTLGFYVGNAANITGRGEVYSQLSIRKL